MELTSDLLMLVCSTKRCGNENGRIFASPILSLSASNPPFFTPYATSNYEIQTGPIPAFEGLIKLQELRKSLKNARVSTPEREICKSYHP